ncbi:UNVERIFIED_CONTAM: hypothetical protein FKN15_062208 [Acipenser sinensis]
MAETNRRSTLQKREQDEVLSRPVSSHLDVGFEDDDEDFRNLFHSDVPSIKSMKQPSAKMHIEAAKMLSFTEEECMKALEWGKS